MSLKTVGVYAAIVLVTVAAGEILARAYDWSPRMSVGAPSDRLGAGRYYHSFEGFGDLVPNQDGYWEIWFHRPYHVQTNSVGLRNAEEPERDALRIYAVGDSQTFGPYLENEDTWPAWTENYLRQQAGAAGKVQVFNAGISGYTIRDELALLREKGVAFKPRLVLLAVFENDLQDLSKPNSQRPAGGTDSRFGVMMKTIARSTALGSLANEVRTQMQLRSAGVDVRAGEGEVARPAAAQRDDEALKRRYGEYFRETVALLKANGIGLAVMFIPESGTFTDNEASRMEPVISALTREASVPYLDLTSAMRNAADPATDLYLIQRDVKPGRWSGNGHLSRQGNAVIGRAVSQWLREQNLVPR